MDISQDLNQQKRQTEHGLEKLSQDNIALQTDNSTLTQGTIERDDKAYLMPDDLNDLEEIDYNEPNVKIWLEKEKVESLQKYGKLTAEEAEYMFTRRLELQKELPNKSAEDLNKIALTEFKNQSTQTLR